MGRAGVGGSATDSRGLAGPGVRPVTDPPLGFFGFGREGLAKGGQRAERLGAYVRRDDSLPCRHARSRIMTRGLRRSERENTTMRESAARSRSFPGPSLGNTIA